MRERSWNCTRILQCRTNCERLQKIHQLLSKADVIRAMHERVQLCQDKQTEFALLRESLEVSRINHILRVHDEFGQRSLDRLFSTSQSGIGFKRARDIASPAHVGSPHRSQTAHPGHDP